jgi:hypothetical protein
MVIGPHAKTILKASGEDNKLQVEACIYAALEHYGPDAFNETPVIMELESEKVAKEKLKEGSSAVVILDEQIRALRQNLNCPGKVIVLADL